MRLNEVLAQNDTAVNHAGTFPDVIELYNEGGASVDLGGFRLSDDPANPAKYIFPAPTILAAGAYLVVYANNADGSGGLHTGFTLDADGEGVYLFNAASVLLDSVTFGLQLPDLSVGRFGASGDWKLCTPSAGTVNVVKPTGLLASVRINEWLASGVPPFVEDFVELYNPNAAPVDLGLCYFTDQPIGVPALQRLAPLTFIAAGGYLKFNADGSTAPRHLDFSLSSDQAQLALLDPNLATVDGVIYGPQVPGGAQGRCPDGASSFALLTTPTPGAPNACPSAVPPALNVLAYSAVWRLNQSNNLDGVGWTATNYNDTAWQQGQGVFGVFSGTVEPVRTFLNPPVGRTIYYRNRFVIPTNLTFASFTLSHYVDDGAVVYVNGLEVYRYNIASGQVTFSTVQVSGHLTSDGTQHFDVQASASAPAGPAEYRGDP